MKLLRFIKFVIVDLVLWSIADISGVRDLWVMFEKDEAGKTKGLKK